MHFMKTETEDFYEILWIRHGLSEGNQDDLAYKKGDPLVQLTDEGWRQGIRAGRFLAQHFAQSDVKEWPLFFVGEFDRHKQTLSAILYGMESAFEGKPLIHGDSRLNEQSFGVLPYLLEQEGDFETLTRQYSKQVREGNFLSARPTHGESPRDTGAHIKSFIDGTLKRDMEQGHRHIVIVTSGRVMDMATLNWFHLPSKALEEGRLKGPNNCDILSFAGSPKNWAVTKIWDGPSATPRHENIIAGINPISFEVLPQLPSHILSEQEFSEDIKISPIVS